MAPVNKFVGYVRVSHPDQVKSGLSIESQIERLTAYYHYLRTRPGCEGLELGPILVELAQSAFNIPLFKRKEGRKLPALLNPGDHIGFIALNRSFRRSLDLINVVLGIWAQSNINVHFLDQQLDTSTATGRMMIKIIADVAEWESDVKSERTKAALDQKRKRGEPIGQWVSPGVRRVKNKRTGRVQTVVDPLHVAVVELIVRLREAGQSLWTISDAVESYVAPLQNRPPRRRWDNRPWSIGRISRWYDWAQEAAAREKLAANSQPRA